MAFVTWMAPRWSQRADDTEKVFEERMRAYEASTAPVVEHYRAQGRFAEVDGDRPIAEIAAGIVAAVERIAQIAQPDGGFVCVKSCQRTVVSYQLRSAHVALKL